MEGQEEVEEEGEEALLRYWMELVIRREEAAGEVPLELRRGPVEGEVGGSPG